MNRVLAGFHAVTARLRADPASIEALYHDPTRRDARMRALLDRARERKVPCMEAGAHRLSGLSPEAPHQGVVALVREGSRGLASLDEVIERASPATLLLLLDGVTDPRNLGACLRTAAGAGVTAVIVPRERSASITPVAAKAAAGAAESVPLVVVTNLARAMRDLRDAGIRICGADAEGSVSLYGARLEGPLAWALGAEGSGLRRLTREHCDELARIPLHGEVESLNVSVAAGICLFETRRRWSKSSPLPPGEGQGVRVRESGDTPK